MPFLVWYLFFQLLLLFIASVSCKWLRDYVVYFSVAARILSQFIPITNCFGEFYWFVTLIYSNFTYSLLLTSLVNWFRVYSRLMQYSVTGLSCHQHNRLTSSFALCEFRSGLSAAIQDHQFDNFNHDCSWSCSSVSSYVPLGFDVSSTRLTRSSISFLVIIFSRVCLSQLHFELILFLDLFQTRSMITLFFRFFSLVILLSFILLIACYLVYSSFLVPTML